ncbi:MAG: hydantoinase/oxoprolinase family protein [bacterium]|nr:hydantoinase/oxoprolinase family protein [Acidimicrobiia bacterium]MCY4650118.1 hydantoinase/oxoprolinase family protein [bacterium]
MLRLGMDVGGTNTDAVLVDDEGQVMASHKAPTTPDPLDGISAAISAVSVVADVSQIRRAMLGTTHSANAIIQRKGLGRVAVLRLAAPSSLAVSPGADWPDDLRQSVISDVAIIEGGYEYDGRVIAELDEAAVRRFSEAAARSGALAVSCAFSPANFEHELRVAEIIASELGDDFPVSLSHRVGTLGLLERENATILNSALLQVSRAVVDGLNNALRENGIEALSYITQNDGTLMTSQQALEMPVLSLGSGPTNSMRGACSLAGLSDAIVVDVGGTSTDVGILVDGFPRESAAAVYVGGVRTNFRMPDLISMGLGGGTIVRTEGTGVAVGPDSVGYRVTEEALVSGGEILTLSDVSVAGGRLTGFGDPARVEELDSSTIEQSLLWVDEHLASHCERMKASRQAMPLLAVGGGAHLVPGRVPGTSEVIRPHHYEVANAFGAAISEASGTVDRVYQYGSSSREECLESARAEALEAAVAAGADPGQARVTSVVEVPMTYVPGGGCRVQVKAAGPLGD